MSFLAELDRYVTLRRVLGADLSTDARILRRFATFADRDGAQHVNTNLVMRWL
jgi:integrase/recombinase XerD